MYVRPFRTVCFVIAVVAAGEAGAFHPGRDAGWFCGSRCGDATCDSPPVTNWSFAGDHETVEFDMLYTGEVFSNTRGGLSTKDATKYQGLLDIRLAVDLPQSICPSPAQFVILGQTTHGRGITESFVGDTQVLSNIDSFTNIAQVSEYYFALDLADGRGEIRVGKQDLNDQFFVVERAADFIQSTFGLSPSTAFPTYPNPSFGLSVSLAVGQSWTLRAGIWDAFARGSSWGFSGNDSILLIGELERDYELSLFGRHLPGVFAVGAVYESAGIIDGNPISAVHEYIFQIEQMLLPEPCQSADAKQGLAAFAGYYPRFPGDQIYSGSIGDSAIGGLVYHGPFHDRDHDTLGIGIAWTELFQGGTDREIAVEAFYKARLGERLFVQPDIQYIASPSGIYRDAIATGLRFQVLY